jgi:hypothetical protein
MNPYDNEKWGVHLVGPDNIYAAKTFDEAVNQAAEFNKTMVIFANRRDCSELAPLCWAKVELWKDISSGPHEPDKTDWSAV